MAAINAGIYGLAYWSFSDEPDDAKAKAFLHWGMMRWMTNGATVRAPYYAYGLLTKFLHGPAEVHQVESSEALVRAAAVRNENTGAWSVAVINRGRQSMPVSIALASDPAKPFRKYVYEVANVPVTEDGDLQEPVAKLAAQAGILADTLAAESLVVYTTAYEDRAPAPVRNLTISSGRLEAKTLKWEAGPDACYFRIYQNGLRIGSTIANEFVDLGPTRMAPGDYKVVAVDGSGNAGAPERVPSGNVPKGNKPK